MDVRQDKKFFKEIVQNKIKDKYLADFFESLHRLKWRMACILIRKLCFLAEQLFALLSCKGKKSAKATSQNRLPCIPLTTVLLLAGTDKSSKGSCYSYKLVLLYVVTVGILSMVPAIYPVTWTLEVSSEQ